MGWTPQMMGACSLWQFVKCYEGWAKSTGRMSANAEPPTADEYKQMLAISKTLDW